MPTSDAPSRSTRLRWRSWPPPARARPRSSPGGSPTASNGGTPNRDTSSRSRSPAMRPASCGDGCGASTSTSRSRPAPSTASPCACCAIGRSPATRRCRCWPPTGCGSFENASRSSGSSSTPIRRWPTSTGPGRGASNPTSYERQSRAARRRGAVPPARFADLAAAYERLKRRRGVVDFDDLLDLNLRAVETDAAFRALVHWRFRHFFVDEAQDLNPLQHALLEAWRDGRPDICLVGDPRQAIYGWNGADHTTMTEVERVYPGVTVVSLSTNYRCSPQVVSAGAAALRASGQRDDTASNRPTACHFASRPSRRWRQRRRGSCRSFAPHRTTTARPASPCWPGPTIS